MGFKTSTRNTFIDNFLGGTIYVALLTTNPSDDDGTGLVEVSGGSYARKLHADWTSSSNGQASNNSAIEFVQATGNWGTITGVALYDALSGGNFLGWGALASSKAINSGDSARFLANELDVQFNTP